MADITKCKGKDATQECSIKEKCYRFSAPENTYRQSFFVKLPLIQDSCDYFVANMSAK